MGGTAGEGGEGNEGGMDSTGGTAGSSNGGSAGAMGGNAGSGQAGGAGFGGGGGAPSWSCSGDTICICSYSTMMLGNPSCPELPCCFTAVTGTTPICTCLEATETVCGGFVDDVMGERVTACPPP
jgi:hypothetical protein